MPAEPIRVVIDARIPGQGWGGVQQVAIGLAVGFTAIAPRDIDVVYTCYPDAREWLLPYVGSADQLKFVPAPPAPVRGKSWVARKVPAARRAYHALMPAPPVPVSDGSLEALHPDLVHFPHQSAFLTRVPSIYHPHDLQHLHLPQFFTRREIAIRETQYRAFCGQAALVAMATTWGRDDILRAYHLPPSKVAVVPLAPVVGDYPEMTPDQLAALRAELKLPEQFCFYPAQTWPHKNHERLLQALASLRDDGLVVPAVFSGAWTADKKKLDRVVDELGLTDQVRWVGYVSPAQLRGVYRLARCVVVPTLFESASQPVFEALSAGVAIACSNVNATPRQVGDAAVIFDPYSVEDMAGAIKRLWSDIKLREDLVARGKRRIAEFTWERTARHFEAYYRQLTHREVSNEDRALISAEPIL